MAGTTIPGDWELEARRVLNINTGNASLMSDTAKGIVRVAIHDSATLKGLFFTAPSPVNVMRQLATSLVSSHEPALAALAGLPISGQPDPGCTICACFNVGIHTIRHAIKEGAANLADLGSCTSAGTNCGSCKPELQTLINTTPILTAAE